MNIQNLKQENGTLLTMKQRGVNSHDNSIKLLIWSLESTLCDYYDAYILVTGDIAIKKKMLLILLIKSLLLLHK